MLSRLCPEDKYHYTACYLPFFTPLVFNNTVVAVCGHYVCSFYGFDDPVHSVEVITKVTRCNNIGQCTNGGIDEMYCTEEEAGEVFKCKKEDSSVDEREISTSRVCGKKCDCDYCDDESNCNGYTYHYWYTCTNSSVSMLSDHICDNNTDCHHGDDENNCKNVTACVREHDSTRTCMLANYSRCTPWTLCGNKMDQTNCSDTTLAPLQCPINGYMSTISERIICKRIIFGEVNKPHSNTFAVCEESMDGQCVTPTSGCYIHKHQLCNNIIDCKDGSDEKSALCNRLTAQECKRKFHYNTSLGLPIWWIGDGVEDCVSGIDEDITKWNSCQYSSFTIYGIGSDRCEDVYICPSGYPLYMEKKALCDEFEILSCQGRNRICSTASSTFDQKHHTLVKEGDVMYLHYCLCGQQDLNTYFEQCELVTYPQG